MMLTFIDSQAQETLGASNAAMGNNGVTVTNVWSVFNNQAALAFVEKPELGVYFGNRYFIREMATSAIAFALPTKSDVVGLSLDYFGFTAFNRQKLGLSYARLFGDKIAAGFQLDYFGFHVPKYGSRHLLTAEAGILAKATTDLTIGFHIFNPTRVQLAEFDEEKLPVQAKAGCKYDVSDKVSFLSELIISDSQSPMFRTGIEYTPLSHFFLRGGIQTTHSFSFGFGFQKAKTRLNLASMYHQYLGFSPVFSLEHAF